mgnify:CR=1 FL=1
MSGLFIFGVIFLAVVCMVIAISKFNMHPFLVLTVIAVLVGLVCGIPTEEVTVSYTHLTLPTNSLV